MRRSSVVVVLAGVMFLASCGRDGGEQAMPTTTPAATSCVARGASEETVTDDRNVEEIPLLTEVRFDDRPCPFVAFVFENEIPPHTIGYEDPPFAECGSGEAVSTSGWGSSAYIVFHSNTASGVDLSGETFRQTYAGDTDIDVSGPVLRRIRRTCDFEATLEWVIALDERRAFRVSIRPDPPQVVIDIAA